MTEPHTLYVFGTGNATMTRYYNTCFAIRSGEEYFMTDAGGGNGILRILEEMQVPLNRIHHLFVTRTHRPHSRRNLDDPDDWHCHQKGKL